MYSEVQRLMINTQPTIIINITTDFGDATALCYLLVLKLKTLDKIMTFYS